MQSAQTPSLPAFTAQGLLPPGDYPLTLAALRNSMLVTGGAHPSPHWDAAWRTTLVDNLAILAGQLRHVGIDRIFVNGSFVTDKDHPNDIDGYFECDPAVFWTTLLYQLNALDPYKSWVWDPASRVWDPSSAKAQLPMWHRYRVELYPHYPGLLTGILDRHGNELAFPAAFRATRDTYHEKGIVRLV